jgi:hypothetical protein
MADLSEAELRAKLRKIERLFAGAGTEGERLAAAARHRAHHRAEVHGDLADAPERVQRG